MKNYLALLDNIIQNGHSKGDRTGTGTLSLFGEQLTFNLQHGFPLLTTKRIYFNAVVHELLWFLRGDTNVKYLNDNKVFIWDEWADAHGNLGKIYGAQWRTWQSGNQTFDQLQTLVSQLKSNPSSRRLLVSAWNVADLPDETLSPQQNVANGKMALAPCHVLFQCYVQSGTLSVQVYQRSADAFLGLPFNIASYALLTHLLAQQCDLQVGKLIMTLGDVHLYTNHIKQAQIQLTRQPFDLPTLKINKASSLLDYQINDIELLNYQCHPFIKGDVAV
jgi:thymidylate synthase